MVSPRACIFYGLNAVRVFSIVALLLVFASSILVIVTDIQAVNRFDAAQTGVDGSLTVTEQCNYIEGSTVPNQAAGVFWAVVQRFLIIFEVIILILSECGWPSTFFERYFPVLAPSFGLGPIGIFECLIGATVLSHHVDHFTLVAGFFLFSIGCVQMLLGLIFREKAKTRRNIGQWRYDARAILPTMQDNRPVFTNDSSETVKSMYAGHSVYSESAGSDMYKGPASDFEAAQHPGFGFGRQGEKHAGLKGFLIAKPTESLPRYASPTPRPSSPVPSSTRASSPEQRESVDSNISVPSRYSKLSRSGSGSQRARSPRFENAPPLPESPVRRAPSPARSDASGPASPPGLEGRVRYQLSDAPPKFQSSTTAI